MGDDIGWMQPSCYHRGLMVGETPNIDRIAAEGGLFMHYYAESSCTAGRTAFITGMHPYRAGMVLPQLPGAISYLRPGTPCLAKFLLDLGYNTGQFGKNHLGDHPDSLPTAHGFQEYWGYLYHLDAMQQVSFLDINKSPTEQGIAPPMKMVPIPGIPEPPGAIPGQSIKALPSDRLRLEPALAGELEYARPDEPLVDSQWRQQVDQAAQHNRAAVRSNGIAPDGDNERRRARWLARELAPYPAVNLGVRRSQGSVGRGHRGAGVARAGWAGECDTNFTRP